MSIDMRGLQAFEKGLDPRHPERNTIPTRVLGYGEISTVLEIGNGPQTEVAYKRMPLFQSVGEAEAYERLYHDYVTVLTDHVGLRVASSDLVHLAQKERGRVIVYIVQPRFPSQAIGNRVIHRASQAQVEHLFLAVMREIAKAFEFNREHAGELEVGLDGQISNWAIAGYDSQASDWAEELQLVYLDTSTPLMRRNGVEQLNPELFLRSAPSFLVWILRLLFLQDVMTRYYDMRKVTIDLIANFFKEGLPELVPVLVDATNAAYSSEAREAGFRPVTVEEVKAYYREDKWIWRLYLTFRKIDRALHGLVRKDYPYILPEHIAR